MFSKGDPESDLNVGQSKVTNLMTASRFDKFTDNSLSKFINDQKNPSTTYKTKAHTKLFSDFLKLKNETRPPHEIPPTELDNHLAHFFVSVKKEGGEEDREYEPGTLKGMQSSIERHLKEQHYEHSIISSQLFFSSREAISSKCKQLKKLGKGNKPDRKRAPSQEEIRHMWESGALGSSSPQTLQHTMWWIMCTRFGMRANKENHQLMWGDLEVQKNSSGRKYLVVNERLTKTRQGTVTSEVKEVIRVFEDKEKPEYCPVQMFEKFAAKRPAQMLKQGTKFYLQPKFFKSVSSMEKDPVWYKRQVCFIKKS